jgi:hypothetical protein
MRSLECWLPFQWITSTISPAVSSTRRSSQHHGTGRRSLDCTECSTHHNTHAPRLVRTLITEIIADANRDHCEPAARHRDRARRRPVQRTEAGPFDGTTRRPTEIIINDLDARESHFAVPPRLASSPSSRIVTPAASSRRRVNAITTAWRSVMVMPRTRTSSKARSSWRAPFGVP